jgi:hypothetical protein
VLVLVLDRSGLEYEYHFIEDEHDCWTKRATSKGGVHAELCLKRGLTLLNSPRTRSLTEPRAIVSGTIAHAAISLQ